VHYFKYWYSYPDIYHDSPILNWKAEWNALPRMQISSHRPLGPAFHYYWQALSPAGSCTRFRRKLIAHLRIEMKCAGDMRISFAFTMFCGLFAVYSNCCLPICDSPNRHAFNLELHSSARVCIVVLIALLQIRRRRPQCVWLICGGKWGMGTSFLALICISGNRQEPNSRLASGSQVLPITTTSDIRLCTPDYASITWAIFTNAVWPFEKHN